MIARRYANITAYVGHVPGRLIKDPLNPIGYAKWLIKVFALSKARLATLLKVIPLYFPPSTFTFFRDKEYSPAKVAGFRKPPILWTTS